MNPHSNRRVFNIHRQVPAKAKKQKVGGNSVRCYLFLFKGKGLFCRIFTRPQFLNLISTRATGIKNDSTVVLLGKCFKLLAKLLWEFRRTRFLIRWLGTSNGLPLT